MKTTTLLQIILLFFIFSCSEETTTENKNKVNSASEKSLIKARNYDSGAFFIDEIKKTKEAISKLESKLGKSKEEITIGKILNNEFIVKNEEYLNLVFRLAALNSGFDSSFDKEYLYIPAIENNGFNMLVGDSYCNFKNVNIKLALNISKEDNSFRLADGSTVVCEGCRRGCNPRRDSNGDGYCTDCQINNSRCDKTETLTHI